MVGRSRIESDVSTAALAMALADGLDLAGGVPAEYLEALTDADDEPECVQDAAIELPGSSAGATVAGPIEATTTDQVGLASPKNPVPRRPRARAQEAPATKRVSVRFESRLPHGPRRLRAWGRTIEEACDVRDRVVERMLAARSGLLDPRSVLEELRALRTHSPKLSEAWTRYSSRHVPVRQIHWARMAPLHDRHIRDLTPSVVATWFAGLKCAQSTALGAASTLRSIVREEIEAGRAWEWPWGDWRPTGPRPAHRPPRTESARAESADELRRLILAALDRDVDQPRTGCQWGDVAARMLFLVATGLRSAEAVALAWEDVSHEGDVYVVRVRHTGDRDWAADGRRRGERPTAPTKSRRVRRIEVGAWISPVVEYLRARTGGDPEGPVLEDDGTGQWAAVPLPHAVVAEVAREAGLRGRWSVHSLRHTHAWIEVACGADVRALQVRMGHDSLGTTVQYLGRLAAASTAVTSSARRPAEPLADVLRALAEHVIWTYDAAQIPERARRRLAARTRPYEHTPVAELARIWWHRPARRASVLAELRRRGRASRREGESSQNAIQREMKVFYASRYAQFGAVPTDSQPLPLVPPGVVAQKDSAHR